MRTFCENIVSPDNLLVVKEESFEYNDFPFHFHPEYEIILLLESSGQRFVGDSVTDFTAVDLCMFGSNLPHKFFSKGLSSKDAVSQVVIQFHENFPGMGFFDRKPFQTIRQLLKRSARGLCFTGETRASLTTRIRHLPSKSPAEAIIEVLHILHQLSLSQDYFHLSSPGFTHSSSFDEDSSRMTKVYEYIVQHFKRDLTLDEVAAVAQRNLIMYLISTGSSRSSRAKHLWNTSGILPLAPDQTPVITFASNASISAASSSVPLS